MFGLFRKKNPYVPPTQKQLSYAKKLGIEVDNKMSKNDVSLAISKVLAKNPKLIRQAEHINAKKQANYINDCCPELITEENKWQELTESYIIAAYEYRKEIVVDVLLVEDAFIKGEKRKKVMLSLASPKLIKDKLIGDYLEWDRQLNLYSEKILYYEPLRKDFFFAGTDAYTKAVKKGLKVAKKLKL